MLPYVWFGRARLAGVANPAGCRGRARALRTGSEKEMSSKRSLRKFASPGTFYGAAGCHPSPTFGGDLAPAGRTSLPLPPVARFAIVRRGGFGRAAPPALRRVCAALSAGDVPPPARHRCSDPNRFHRRAWVLPMPPNPHTGRRRALSTRTKTKPRWTSRRAARGDRARGSLPPSQGDKLPNGPRRHPRGNLSTLTRPSSTSRRRGVWAPPRPTAVRTAQAHRRPHRPGPPRRLASVRTALRRARPRREHPLVVLPGIDIERHGPGNRDVNDG